MRANFEVVQLAQALIQRCHNLNVQQVPRKLPSLHQHSTMLHSYDVNCHRGR